MGVIHVLPSLLFGLPFENRMMQMTNFQGNLQTLELQTNPVLLQISRYTPYPKFCLYIWLWFTPTHSDAQ